MKKICIGMILTVAILAVAAPLSAYVIGIVKSDTGEVVYQRWKSTAFPLRWQLNPVKGARVTGDRSQAEVFEASFAAWQAVNTASVSFARDADSAPGAMPGDDGVNLITTNTASRPMPSGVYALTLAAVYAGPGFDPVNQRNIEFAGQIAEADIFFNSTVDFSTSAAAVPGRTDLQSVATHEIGHLLGLDHSPLISATMYWSLTDGVIYPRNISLDDASAISILYPSSLFASRGSLRGVVRTTANSPVYGAVVVAVNSNGVPVASAITAPDGSYKIEGLNAGSYSVYAEPLDGPMTIDNVGSYTQVYGKAVNTTFTSRSR